MEAFLEDFARFMLLHWLNASLESRRDFCDVILQQAVINRSIPFLYHKMIIRLMAGRSAGARNNFRFCRNRRLEYNHPTGTDQQHITENNVQQDSNEVYCAIEEKYGTILQPSTLGTRNDENGTGLDDGTDSNLPHLRH